MIDNWRNNFLVIGLDCMGSEVLRSNWLATQLPNLQKLISSGISGTLESTIPPITVPAWTSMLTGRDPGEVGIYGFRNRRSYSYGDLIYATSKAVRYPRLWDFVGKAGGYSIVVGVPQTWPATEIKGKLVAGFEAGKASRSGNVAFAWPHDLEKLINCRFATKFVK